LLVTGSALAQERNSSGNFLDNLFGRGDPQPQSRQGVQPPVSGQVTQSDPGDLSVRLDRMENALRQLTGTIEQLQYRNQQLQMQLKRMQDDTDYRFQQQGARGAIVAPPQAAPGSPGGTPPASAAPGRRSDVFDPAQHPNAPGAPRTLGNQAVIAAPEPTQDSGAPVGAPGGRAAGAPLDLSSVAGNDAASSQAPAPPSTVASANAAPAPAPAPQVTAPTQQPRIINPNGPQLATLPPSATPQDEYDLAYGYVLHKDYSLAEQALRDFLKKYPNERLVPDAQYWLGESL